jgi:alcohol dehydrogenase class IV
VAFQRGRQQERNEQNSIRQAAMSTMENLLRDEKRESQTVRDALAEAVDALTETLQHPDHVSDEVRKERNRHALDIVARAALATPDTPPDA